MRRIWWTVVLGSLVVLLAGCGAPAAQPLQRENPTRAVQEATQVVLAPTSTPSPPAVAPAATSTPRPATEEPAPTSTPPPATAEPTSTSTPPPTATPTVPPPTLTPTDTPAAVFSGDAFQRVAPAEAKALLDSGSAVLYDVRSEDQYQAQHAAGALSFPGGAAAARHGELPADKTLIFY